MKTIAIIFFISLAVISCDSIQNEDLQGNWVGMPVYDPATDFAYLQFNSDQLKTMTPEGLVKSYTYDIDQNRIKLIASDQSFKIYKAHQDTLFFKDVTYVRGEPNFFPDEYEIIGIDTGIKLKDSTVEYLTLHAYRDSNDTFRIRSYDKYIPAEHVKFAVSDSRSHSPLPDTAIFIGENLKLMDLKMIYYELMDMNIRQVYLILDQNFPNEYFVFKDYVEIWWEDMNKRNLEKYGQSLPKEYFPAKSDLYENEVLVTKIKNNDHFNNLDNLDQNKTHFIIIDSDMKIDDYINLKIRIAELRKGKFQIATEIGQ